MPKTLDELVREFGVTESDMKLIRQRPGLRRSIGMYIRSQCLNTRKLPRLTEKEIEDAVRRIRRNHKKVTQFEMSVQVGLGIFGASLFRQVLRDFPKLEAAFERAKAR